MNKAVRELLTIIFVFTIFFICLFNIDKTPVLAVIMVIDIIEGFVLLDI